LPNNELSDAQSTKSQAPNDKQIQSIKSECSKQTLGALGFGVCLVLDAWCLVIKFANLFAAFLLLIFGGMGSMMPYDVSRSHAGATGLASP
jgi:hypothetical protein